MRKHIFSFLLAVVAVVVAIPTHAQIEFCRPASPPLQPVEPVAMNSVAFHRLVKTIHVEKEVFVCQDGTIKDVQIYTEIIENLKLPSTAVQKTFEVVTCFKDPRTVKVACKTTKPAELPVPIPPLPIDPDPQAPGPGDPIEMNTVQVGPLVKTIMSEKEIFRVPSATGASGTIRDIVIFTEIIQDLSANVDFVVEKKVEVAVCDKTFEGDVIGCSFLPEQRLFPPPDTPPSQ